MYQPKKQLLNDATEPLLNVFPMNKVFKESIKNAQNWKKIVLSMLFVLFTVLSSIAQSVEVETNADRKDFPQQIKGWEWIVFDERNELTTTYPITLKYSSYPSHPQYKVIDRAIYAEDGTLAGIVYCLRYKQAFDSNLIKESIDNFIDQEHKNQFSKFIDKGDWKKDVITLIQSSSLPEGFYIQNPRPGDTVEDNLLRVPAQFDSIQQLYENGNGFDSWGCPLFSVLKDKGEGKGYQQETVDGSKVHATYSLSEEDMKSLTKYIDELNQKSTYFSFDIIEGEISNTVYCKIKSIPKEQQQDYGTEKIEILKNNWAQFVRPNVYSELKDVEEATQKLTQTLAVSDYKNNKYAINKEPQSVRIEIEKKLGIRPSDTDAQKKWGETQAIKIMCKHLGIAYTPGMTKEKLGAALKKKYRNLDQITIATKLQKAIYASQIELASKAAQLANSMPNVDPAKLSTATRYVEQLYMDNSKWTGKLKSITRIDATSFKLTYGEGKDLKYATIKYYTDKPFCYKYKVVIN